MAKSIDDQLNNLLKILQQHNNLLLNISLNQDVEKMRVNRLEKFLVDTERRRQEQYKRELAEKEAQKILDAERRRKEQIEKAIEERNQITKSDGVGSASLKSLLAFVAQMNPITALLYQNAGTIFKTAEFFGDRFRDFASYLLNLKNLYFGRGHTFTQNAQQSTQHIPATMGGTAVGFLQQRSNSVQSIGSLDNLNIDKVTNLKIDNTAAAQLKIHQAMIWADQAVIIPNNGPVNTLKNVGLIEDKTKINERLLPPSSSESKTEKITRQLSEGFSGLNDSLKKSTEAIKTLTIPLLWVGLGVGALIAAILGLKTLFDIRDKNKSDKADQLRDMSQKAQAGSDTFATGTNISSMNSGTISDVIQKLWNGKFNGKIGESNSAFWDYSDGAVNSVTYGTEQGKRTPVIVHFDGTVIAVNPMTGLKEETFEIAVERDNFFRGMASNTLIGKLSNKDNGYSNKNIVVFRGVLEPQVKVNQHIPKGYVIGYSDGAVTLVGENAELLNDYLSDITDFTDNNYAKAADITKSELDKKASLFGNETMLDSINKAHTQMALDLASDAANYEDKAIDTESPWWLSAIRKADKWDNLIHNGEMTTDITDTSSLINKFIGTPTGGAASITDNVSKNSVEADNNANRIISSNVQNNGNGYSGEVPSYDKLSATAKNPEIGTIEFGLMDDNDIAMVCGQYSDVGLKI